MVAPTKRMTFDGLTEGQTVNAANTATGSGDPVSAVGGGAMLATAQGALNGPMGAEFAGTAASSFFNYNITGTTSSVGISVCFKIVSGSIVCTTAQGFAQVRNATLAALAISLQTGGLSFIVQDGAGANVYTSSTLADGWYTLWACVVKGTTTSNGQIMGVLRDSLTDAVIASFDSGATKNTGTTDYSINRWGKTSGTGNLSGFYVDNPSYVLNSTAEIDRLAVSNMTNVLVTRPGYVLLSAPGTTVASESAVTGGSVPYVLLGSQGARVAVRAAKTSPLSWNVRARTTKTVAASWNTRTRTTQTTGVSWNVTGKASKTVGVSWNVRTRASTTSATSWNVLTHGTKTSATSWNVAAPAGARPSKAVSVSWNVRVRAPKTTALSWNTRQRFANTITNLIPDPFPSTGARWTVTNRGTSTGTFAKDAEFEAMVESTTASGNNILTFRIGSTTATNIPVQPGVTYTQTIEVMSTISDGRPYAIDWKMANNVTSVLKATDSSATNFALPAGQWVTLTLTATAPDDAVAASTNIVHTRSGTGVVNPSVNRTAGAKIYYRRATFVASPTPVAYFDGNTPGSMWTSTPNNSPTITHRMPVFWNTRVRGSLATSISWNAQGTNRQSKAVDLSWLVRQRFLKTNALSWAVLSDFAPPTTGFSVNIGGVKKDATAYVIRGGAKKSVSASYVLLGGNTRRPLP